jgi:hypothetical protein
MVQWLKELTGTCMDMNSILRRTVLDSGTGQREGQWFHSWQCLFKHFIKSMYKWYCGKSYVELRKHDPSTNPWIIKLSLQIYPLYIYVRCPRARFTGCSFITHIIFTGITVCTVCQYIITSKPYRIVSCTYQYINVNLCITLRGFIDLCITVCHYHIVEIRVICISVDQFMDGLSWFDIIVGQYIFKCKTV